MVKITDSLGTYEPKIDCKCIDGRTLAHIEISLDYAYRGLDKIRNDASIPKNIRKSADERLRTVLDLKDIFKKMK